jgi:hypothetical protein
MFRLCAGKGNAKSASSTGNPVSHAWPLLPTQQGPLRHLARTGVQTRCRLDIVPN